MTTTVLYIDPALHFADCPRIIKESLEAIRNNNAGIQSRLRKRMEATNGFARYQNDTIGFAPFDLTCETYVTYVINKDMACLEPKFLIGVIEALHGASSGFLLSCFNTVILAINTLINVHMRTRRNTELTLVANYEPAEKLPLSEIAGAFGRTFAPVLKGRIEEAFESYIDENDEGKAAVDEEISLLGSIRSGESTAYSKWRGYVVMSGYEDQFQGMTETSTPETDGSYRRLREACLSDDMYLGLIDRLTRRQKTFDDINEALRGFRAEIIKGDPSLAVQSGTLQVRSRSAPSLAKLSRRSSTNLLARQGSVASGVLSAYMNRV